MRKNNNKTPKILDIVILGKFDDGTCRQIVVKKNTANIVLSVIAQLEGSIRVLETEIKGIDIKTGDNE